MVKISQFFVAFLENINFKKRIEHTWNEHLFASPIEIFPGGATKRINNTSYAALFSSAGIVKVKHALNCFKLSSVNDGSSFFGEQIIDIATLVVYMSSSIL